MRKMLTLALFLLLFTLQPGAASEPGSELVLARATVPPHLVLQPATQLQGMDPATRPKIEPALLKQMLQANEGGTIKGIVIAQPQDALSTLNLEGMTGTARKAAVVNRLQSVAEASQGEIRAFLQRAYLDGDVAAFRSLWIANSIAVEASAETFWQLAARPDVSRIAEDHIHYLPDREWVDEQDDASASPTGDIPWNIARIQADQTWNVLGITGTGITVANMDSGVDWQHPALMSQYRGYTGKPWAIHEGNWYCATNEAYAYPGDGLGHGTHTMGIMVAQDGIGVAPGAQWIAVKVFDNQGVTYDSWIHDGFQWILAPGGDPALAPDVVSNSWGSNWSSDESFLADVRALRAAGIFTAFAAGNNGPEPGTIQSPASYRESFAVGATDTDNLIALFSGRGPSPWREIKPEVCAPGIGILSAAPGGAWRVRSGTSAATPQVAGVVALMLEANPALTVQEIETILTETAMPLGSPHPNDSYGWGLVDAYAAVAAAGQLGRLAGTVTGGDTGTAIPGAVVQVVSHEIAATAYSDVDGCYSLPLSAGTYDVTASAFGYVAHISRNIAITRGLTTALDISLRAQPTGILHGFVRESGTLMPLQATVAVPGTPSSVTSDATDGAYSLALPEGTHVIRVQSPAHRFLTATVSIQAGASVRKDFELDPAPTILLVDSGAWYNGSQRAYYEEALEDLHYLADEHIVTSVIAPRDVPTFDDLEPYDLVIWSAPQDAPGYIGATDAITHYLDTGGRLLLSGQDVAFWDGGGNGWFYDPYLLRYLKARFVRDNAASRTLDGQGSIFAGMTVSIAGVGGANNQLYPDVIASADENYAASAWAYRQDGSGGQSIGPCLPYRAIYLAFGLEAIDDAAARRQVLGRAIEWATSPPQKTGIELIAQNRLTIAQPGQEVTHAVRLRNLGEMHADSYAIGIAGNTWPTSLQGPTPVALGACQSITLQISVTIPAGIGWDVSDVAQITAGSVGSFGLAATEPLTTKTPAPVLLVDGARFYDVQERYRAALETSGIAYDYHRVKEGWPLDVPEPQTLAMYPAIVWYTGYDWYQPLDPTTEDRLIRYLESGGRLFLSSQDYLYYGQGKPLARDYLGVLDYNEYLTATLATGEIKHPIGWGIGTVTLTYPYPNWSDALVPVSGAQVAFRGQHGLPIGITYQEKGWKTTFFAFPFEALDPAVAPPVMARTVGWLSWLGSSTWEADRRTISSGDLVTMTGILRNDAAIAMHRAYLTATLPAQLSVIPGSLSAGAVYHPLTRTVTWSGPIEPGGAFTVQLGTQVATDLPPAAPISFPAHIGYDDHSIAFERPYILRANAPDLSSSRLACEPQIAHPHDVIACALDIRNVGVLPTMATLTVTQPALAWFTDTVDSGQIGTSTVLSDRLLWAGPVAAQGAVTLTYHLVVSLTGDSWMSHHARLDDSYGETWYLEEHTDIRYWKSYLSWILK